MEWHLSCTLHHWCHCPLLFWLHVLVFLFILCCSCSYISNDCCALQITNYDVSLMSSGKPDLFLFCKCIPTWSSKRCLWCCNFKRQFPAICFDCYMKGHEICVFADVPRWTRLPLQSVFLVAALLLKSCMQAMAQFNFALDLLLVERGIIVMHFIQLFYYWCLSGTSQEWFS